MFVKTVPLKCLKEISKIIHLEEKGVKKKKDTYSWSIAL